jgi:hypothetical protein
MSGREVRYVRREKERERRRRWDGIEPLQVERDLLHVEVQRVLIGTASAYGFDAEAEWIGQAGGRGDVVP